MTKSGRNYETPPPSLFAWSGSLATLGTIGASQLLPQGNSPVLRGVGLLLLALSPALILVPMFGLGRHGQGERGSTYMQTRAVVDRGLYAVVRHPQYLGYMLLAGGFALLSQHGLVALLAAVAWGSFYGQAIREERYAITRFGEAYDYYLQRVPRFNIILGLMRLARGRGTRPRCD